MPNPGANLWVSQADSDRFGASRLYDKEDHRTYCQTIAKYQQVVEKSVKAIAAAVNEAGIMIPPVSHYYRHDVGSLISLLRHLPDPKVNRHIQEYIERLLSDHNSAEIKVLSNLAPKKPGPDMLHARNTEYPYETAPGAWTAPALPSMFNIHEVERFASLAERIYRGTLGLVSALRRQRFR